MSQQHAEQPDVQNLGIPNPDSLSAHMDASYLQQNSADVRYAGNRSGAATSSGSSSHQQSPMRNGYEDAASSSSYQSSDDLDVANEQPNKPRYKR
jgi:hypothetical protein